MNGKQVFKDSWCLHPVDRVVGKFHIGLALGSLTSAVQDRLYSGVAP